MTSKVEVQVFNAFCRKKTKFWCIFNFLNMKTLKWISQYWVDFMHIPCCKWMNDILVGWLVMDIKIKILDDGFQAEHRLTDIPCTDPEHYLSYDQCQKCYFLFVNAHFLEGMKMNFFFVNNESTLSCYTFWHCSSGSINLLWSLQAVIYRKHSFQNKPKCCGLLACKSKQMC